ncbi:hypothetical protein [Actinomadura sp. SCN-SB]|uniref:hypothetical protein n=1 Tax=Actinomadura sp. SCN-SB TaxID=3373092 RepID=UPI00375061CE
MALQRRSAPMGVTAAGLALAGLALAGCDAPALPSGLEDNDGYGRPVGGIAPSTVPGNGVPGDGAPVAITSLRILPAGPLGDVVADDAGRLLYRFDRDRPRPSLSNCVGACARKWPPVRWSPRIRITAGIPEGRVGGVRRPDGTLQLTLSGWPLYRYSGDTAPGDANGQGVGGWFVARPNGAKATFGAGTPPPPGYGQGTGGVVIGEKEPRTAAPPGTAGGGPSAPGG